MPSSKKWNTANLSTGDRSLLRRSAGQMIGSDMRAAEVFYRAVGYCPENSESIWYAAICLECLWREEDHPRIIPFEEILRIYYNDKDTSDSFKRRIVALLDVPWGSDGFMLGKLANLVRTLKSKDSSIMPDFDKLADDLKYWNNDSRSVQRRWLRTIFKMQTEENVTEVQNNVD